MAENELMHYGRRGMKWYQHIYGEFQSGAKYSKKGTAAKPTGKKTTALERAKAKKASDEAASKRPKKPEDPVKKLSDQELQNRINRLRNEQTYKELVRGKPSLVSRGAKTVSQILSQSAKQTATKYVSQWMDKQVKNALENRKKDKK